MQFYSAQCWRLSFMGLAGSGLLLLLVFSLAFADRVFQDRFEPVGITPVQFATVELRNAAGQVKSSSHSNVDGHFPVFTPDMIESGDAIVVYGGFWRGRPFLGEFRLLLADVHASQVVTELTTLVSAVAAAGFAGGSDPAERLNRAVTHLASLYMIDAADWNSRSPARVAPLFHAIRDAEGVQNWVLQLLPAVEAGEIPDDYLPLFPALNAGVVGLDVLPGPLQWLSEDAGHARLRVVSGLDPAPDWVLSLVDAPAWVSLEGDRLLWQVPASVQPGPGTIGIEVANPQQSRSRTVVLEFEIEEGTLVAEQPAGPAGGEVLHPQGRLTVTAPPGAFDQPVTLQLIDQEILEEGTTTRFRFLPADAEVHKNLVHQYGRDPGDCTLPPGWVSPGWRTRQCTKAEFLQVLGNPLLPLDTGVALNRVPYDASGGEFPFWSAVGTLTASALQSRCAACFDRTPVLFIDDISLSAPADGSGRWNELPDLLHDYGGGQTFAVYEFRYRSNARFKDVARDLGAAIKYIHHQTFQDRVHLVSHSFGGLVARAYLQGLAANSPAPIADFSDCQSSRHPYVESLLTLGTPHSGIARYPGPFHGADLPAGRDDLMSRVEACTQLSCWEAGAHASVFSPAGTSSSSYAQHYGVSAEPGQLIAELNDFASNELPVPTRSLVGLHHYAAGGPRYSFGDTLVSYQGQRFSPRHSCSGSSCKLERIVPGAQTIIDGQPLGHCLFERVLGSEGPQPLPQEAVPDVGLLERSYIHSPASFLGLPTGLPAESWIDRREHLPNLGSDYSGSWASTHDAFNEILAWLDPGPPERNVALIIQGQGSVQIDSGGEQFDCTASCVVPVSAASATLVADPDAGAVFDQFVGCQATSDNQCTLDVGPWTGVTVRFTGGASAAQLTLGIAGDGLVAVSPGHEQCTDRCTYAFEAGTSVTLSAKANNFNGWSGACSGSDVECAVELDTAGSLAAVTASYGPHASPPIATGLLNDTGIDWCKDYDNNFLDCPVSGYPGQDGDYGRDALARQGLLEKVGAGAAGFDYTKLDANGSDLPASATEWSCVRDNHTGLIWEVKVDEPRHLRNREHTYSWYNPDPGTNGGDAGTQDGGSCAGSACDTLGFVQAVNDRGLCGDGQWRIPTRMELHSLTHEGQAFPAIDTDYFPVPAGGDYWSASPHAVSPDIAWGVSFSEGHGGYPLQKSFILRMRLVRGGQ